MERVNFEKELKTLSVDDLLEVLTSSQREDIYRSVKMNYIKEDCSGKLLELLEEYEEDVENSGLDFSEGGELFEKIITNSAYAYVYCGSYDCSISFWDNIENLIKEELFDVLNISEVYTY